MSSQQSLQSRQSLVAVQVEQPEGVQVAGAAAMGVRLRKGLQLTVQASRLDDRGYGLVQLPRAQIRVQGLLPGEQALVCITHISAHQQGQTQESELGTGSEPATEELQESGLAPAVVLQHKKSLVAYARILRRETAASVRVVPACHQYGACGGCVLQHLDYTEQRKWKTLQVEQALAAFAVSAKDCVQVASPFQYRSRVKLVVAKQAAGVALGAYAPRSHRVLPMTGCQVNTRRLTAVAKTLAAAVAASGISIYEETAALGALRYILLREVASGAVQISLVSAEPVADAQLRMLLNQVTQAHPEVQSVVLHRNSQRGNALLQESTKALPGTTASDSSLAEGEDADAELGALASDQVLLGEPFLWEDLGILPQVPSELNAALPSSLGVTGKEQAALVPNAAATGKRGVRVRVSARAFLQVNRAVAAQLYADVATALAPAATDTILDLYCGVGGLGRTVMAAAPGSKLIGVELNASAIADAQAGAEAAGLSANQARFVCGEVESVLPALAPELFGNTLAIINPPRKGCTPKVLAALLQSAPSAIAYVSCNPHTLARDLKTLCEREYVLTQVTPYDMHPGTLHVETVAILKRRAPSLQ